MKRTLVVMLFVFMIIGCSTTKTADLSVRTSFDEDTDFSTWKTYRFATSTSSDDGSQRYPRFDQQVRTAIEENLSERDYQRIEDGVPDFRIAAGFSSRGDQGSDPDRRYANEPTTSTKTVPTITNTLVIKMLHPATSQVLWQGQVSNFNLDAVQTQAEFRKAVWRLFAEFPPITR